ncbi:MAG: acetolactate decarboxylase [Prevotellaceae bacterium]|nr:acetolactate decarboxylase [Candidatus Faecinaster equi]
MRKFIIYNLIAILIFTISSCKKNYTYNDETMYQIATVPSLMIGNYNSYITVETLRKMGDIGLGTFENIDGEMIILNDTIYQARYDGTVNIADNKMGVPFATITHFNCDIQLNTDSIHNLNQLTTFLTGIVKENGENLIYVAKINIPDCDSLTVRSEMPQQKPYKPLAEVMKTAQREFSYSQQSGIIVAVYFPPFYSNLNVPGWHFHFISNDRKKGGHLFSMVCNSKLHIELDATPYFNMYMPEDSSFVNATLENDMSDNVKKIEKANK